MLIIQEQHSFILLDLNLIMIGCILAEQLYVSLTIGVWIGKWLYNHATTDNRASHTSLTNKVSWHEI